MDMLNRAERFWSRLTDGTLEPSPEPTFQPYCSRLPSRGLEACGIATPLTLAITSETVQTWVDRRWHTTVSELHFLAENVIRPGDVVIECTSGYGVRSMGLAALVGPGGTVIGFEPRPQHRDVVTRNVDLNAIPNLTVEPLALGAIGAIGSTPGIAVFHRHLDGEWRRCEKCPADTFSGGCPRSARGTHRVSLTTLDAYVHEHDLQVDVLVLDAKGSEIDVLNGAAELLSCYPRLWIAMDPEAVGRQCSLVELGQVLELSQYDWSIVSRNRIGSDASVAVTSVPSYILGVPRPARCTAGARPTVGSHPTVAPLESYSR